MQDGTTELIEVVEGTACTIRGNITDAAEPPANLTSASVSSVTWTLYEMESGSKNIVAGINGTALTPATVIPSSGNFVLDVTAAQNVLVDSTLESERHKARVTFVSGSKTYKAFFVWRVVKDRTP
jgi:hypothetical protein